MKTFKKILLGLLLLVATVGNAQSYGLGNHTLINEIPIPAGPLPIYEEGGTVQASNTTSLNVSYTSIVNSNDILLITINSGIGLGTITVGDGFSLLFQKNGRFGVWWKRANGTETGTVNISTTNSSFDWKAKMDRYSGCIESGDPFESPISNGNPSGGTERSLNYGTPSGDNTLIVTYFFEQQFVVTITNNNTSFVNQYGIVGSSELWLYLKEIPIAIDGGTWSISSSSTMVSASLGFFLKPT